jgi:hypothetical protein
LFASKLAPNIILDRYSLPLQYQTVAECKISRVHSLSLPDCGNPKSLRNWNLEVAAPSPWAGADAAGWPALNDGGKISLRLTITFRAHQPQDRLSFQNIVGGRTLARTMGWWAMAGSMFDLCLIAGHDKQGPRPNHRHLPVNQKVVMAAMVPDAQGCEAMSWSCQIITYNAATSRVMLTIACMRGGAIR